MIPLHFKILIAINIVVMTVGNNLPFLGHNALRILIPITLTFLVAAKTSVPRPYLVQLPRDIKYLILLWSITAVTGIMVLGVDNINASRETLDLFLGFAISAIPWALSKRFADFKNLLLQSWLLGYITATCFSILEFYTGNKLDSNFTRTQESYVFDSVLLLSTFDNPNNYAVFLLLTLPFLCLGLLNAGGKKTAFAYVAAITTLIPQMILTGCRAGNIGLLLFFLLSPLLNNKVKIAIFCMMIGLIFSTSIDSQTGAQLLSDLPLITKLNTISDEWNQGSVRERIDLVTVGLNIDNKNLLMGIGPGQFETVAYADSAAISVRNLSLHSLLLEILVQYGLLVFIAFLYSGIKLIAIAWKTKLATPNGEKQSSAMLILAAWIIFPIAIHINSSNISLQFLWFFLGSQTLLTINPGKPEMSR